MAKDNKSEIIMIRVDPDLKSDLQKMADADMRKLSDFIRIQLQKLIKKSSKS